MASEEVLSPSVLARIARELADPKKLRILTLALACSAIGVVHLLMNGRISEVRAKIKRETERRHLVDATTALRGAQVQIKARLPERAPTTFWTEYLIGGVREAGLGLQRMTPVVLKERRIDSRQGVEIQIDLAGEFRQLYRFVAWLESGRWPVRVTRVNVTRSEKGLNAQVVVAVLANGEV